jgi:hypothetical protein
MVWGDFDFMDADELPQSDDENEKETSDKALEKQ